MCASTESNRVGQISTLSVLQQAYIDECFGFEPRAAFELMVRAATTLDRETFIYGFVLPMLEQLRAEGVDHELWSVIEDIAYSQLRATLSTMLTLSPPSIEAPRVLIAALDEPVEHRLVLSALLAMGQGLDPVIVRPSLSISKIEALVRASGADVLFLALKPAPSEAAREQVRTLRYRLAIVGVQLWCSEPTCSTSNPVDTPSDITAKTHSHIKCPPD